MNKEFLAAGESVRSQVEAWHQYMHRNPEVSMAEDDTARYIESELKKIGGYEIVTGVGKYGIVASMTLGDSKKSIGFRADFDALPIDEVNDLSYKSERPGCAHLCGHDAHAAMLLGAAKYLSETKGFNGTVRLIFQPGEETMQGGPAMVSDGLFERFPVDAVYGMHNMPGLELGKFYFRSGEMMAAVDNWEIEITGKGSHGSMPEKSIDSVVCGSSVVMALQSIVSRNVSPWQNSVVSVGAFLAGNAGNVIAHTAILRLSIRNMEPGLREFVLNRIRDIVKYQCQSYNCTYEIREGVPGAVLVNSEAETEWATNVARETFGAENVVNPGVPYMGSEDFAFMLQALKKGTYCMVGNGDTQMVHHPNYYTDPAILPLGVSYWVALAYSYLK